MDNQLNSIQIQIQGINTGMEKIERNVEKVSEGMIQLVEFRKEAEFLNKELLSDRKRLIALEDETRSQFQRLSADVSQQRASAGVGVKVLGFLCSASLMVGIYVAGANSKFQDKVQEMDKSISVLQSVMTNSKIIISSGESHK